ncbi:CLUMA_CG008867, isoform A [Clunio marinus]|uniref:CLUMA_CG008867, isoform A n=1 Tax=Clunio marinus TaxID=568069 RepID=A0A1J1I6H7_9DIPT|nr:CLUMA_CG008867, isoform A [Clunio marinus]
MWTFLMNNTTKREQKEGSKKRPPERAVSRWKSTLSVNEVKQKNRKKQRGGGDDEARPDSFAVHVTKVKLENFQRNHFEALRKLKSLTCQK